MMKKVLIASILTTLLAFVLIASLSFSPAIGDPTNVTFQVNLTITGNNAPAISWVQSSLSAYPTEGATTTVYIAFNATDANTFEDIDYTTAQIILKLNGEQARTSASCVNFRNASPNTMWFNCTILMYYYDVDGNWQINASVADLAAAHAEDIAETFQYNTLSAIRSNIQGITFGNVNLGQQTGAQNDPMILNNTGNQNFTQVNITAYDLSGEDPNYAIEASNFFVNSSYNAFGDQLQNDTMILITNATLARDIAGVDTIQNLYFWVDMPAAGLTNQYYSSYQDWIIQVS